MSKILTVCSQGLVRSVGLADVLKLHFEPVDVVPVGCAKNANTSKTLLLLGGWADFIVCMEPRIKDRFVKRIEGLSDIPEEEVAILQKILICDVGPDTYGGKHNRRNVLIDKVWRWARANQNLLNIKEHNKRL